MKNIIKNNILLHVVIFIFLFLIAFVFNNIPHNSIIGSGDYIQLYHPYQQLYFYVFSWAYNGTVGGFNPTLMSAPYYALLSMVDNFFPKDQSVISHFYIFILITLSYISFYISTKLVFPDLKRHIRVGSSLVYSLNNFTLTVFTYSWGYTHQFIIYIFIPLLVGAFIKIILEHDNIIKNTTLLLLCLIISLPSFNNAAFLELVLLLQALFLLLFVFVRQVSISKKLFIKLFAVGLAYLLVFYWFILANYSYLHAVVQRGTVVGFSKASITSLLSATSSNFVNSLSLFINNSRPDSLSLLSGFSLLYFVVIIVLLLKIKNLRKHKLIISSFSITLFFVLLSVRAYGPLAGLNLFIYSSTILSPFRSPDKVLSAMPFLYSFLLLTILIALNLRNKINFFIFFLLLLIPYQFYFNGIGKVIMKQDAAGYQMDIKVPSQYLLLKGIVEKNNKLTSIISLPFSVVNSFNWSNYPKWHYYGVDFLGSLYNKGYISANTSDLAVIGNKYSFKEYNDFKQKPEILLELIQRYSGEYVFYHKDIDSQWIKKTNYVKKSLDLLTKESKLSLVVNNDYFDLYKVADKYLMPLISSSNNLLFKQINPTKYKISLTVKGNQNVVFNQSYNPEWKLFLDKNLNNSWCQSHFKYLLFPATECVSKRTFFEGDDFSYLIKKPLADDNHVMINDYANKWVINENYIKQNYSLEYYKVNSDGSINVELTMYFKPQSYFYMGFITDGLLLIFGFVYLGFIYIYGKKHKV